MAKKIFYEKVGRRYKPVYEYDQKLLDSYPKGNHLVMCYPGGKSTRYHVQPALAPMIAAGRVAEDKIREAFHKASEGRPQKQKLTPAQIEAWQNMQKALGDDRFYLQYPSIVDAVEAGMKAMQDEAEKLLTNPSVKSAYEHFLLVCALVKEHSNE